jgi:hypothetical protein
MAAFLRVYEPLEALRNVAPADPDAGPLAVRERAAALRAASALPPRVVSDFDLLGPDDDRRGIFATLLSPEASDGITRLCPADLSARALAAVEELRASLDPVVLSALISEAAVDEAARRLAAHPAGAGRAPHVRSCAWPVPLPWFALFEPGQRLVERPDGDLPPADASDGDRARPSTRSTAVTVRYLAPMADARRCVARALGVVRRAPTDLLPSSGLEALGRWLEEFHARSVVELDFGGLVDLLPPAEFADDNSVASVAAAIANLRAGATEAAAAGLVAVRDRWAAVRAFERSS